MINNLNFLGKVKSEFDGNFNNNDLSIQHRKTAIERVMNFGLPTLKHEDWKYANLSFLNKIDYTSNYKQKPNDIKIDFDKFKISDIDVYNIFLVNGLIINDVSDIPDNLIIDNLENRINSDNTIKFNDIQEERQTIFSSINTTLYKNGLYINFDKHTIFNKAFHFIYINDCSDGNNFSNLRRYIEVGTNTEVTIIESFVSSGNFQPITNSLLEVNLGENAKLNHFKIQSDTNAIHFDFIQAKQSKHSNYSNLTFTSDGAFVRNNLNSLLNSENCETHFLGVFIGDQDNIIDNHTFVDHAKPNCMSNENYRGILFDKSTGIFNGKILVRKDAQKTNAYQSNKNILASKDATINTKPELEIYADDVKCSHGATSGSLDKNSMFYLRARGLDPIKAESLLMNAFVSSVIEEIPNVLLKNYLKKIIVNKLNKDLHFINEEDLISLS